MPDDVFDAIRENDAKRLIRVLEADPGLGARRNADGMSPLSLAAYMGRTDLVEIIRSRHEPDFYEALIVGEETVVTEALDGGRDPNGRAPDGFTPLGLAVFFGHDVLARRLIDAGADLDLRADNAQQVGPIHAAVAQQRSALLELLLAGGADPNAPQQQGVRPVHGAASRGDAPAVALLVFYGADLTIRTDAGESAADFARERDHPHLAERIERFTGSYSNSSADV